MVKNSKYKFSVVIPVYNVEEYVEETILSVINQDIGFKDNIQMILVNDGSPDNSDKICKKYKEQYPDNIIYIEKENGGVSSARNTGIKYIEGKYVNFLDSDDKWESDAFRKVWDFFEKNKEKIDVVACRLRYFEAASGCGHPLNFKFTKDRVIHIEYDYNHIQMHMASCFIKSEKITNLFDTELKYGEDSLFINQIILQQKRYGVMSSVDYMYRKRANESSAIDTCQQRVEFYDKTLTHFHDEIIRYAKELNNGELPFYVQSLVMYDFQWRVKRPIPEGILTKEESIKYIEHVKNILKNIDNFIIAEQKNIWSEHKIYALNLKHDYDIRDYLTQRQNELYYKNLKLFTIKNQSLVKIEDIVINNDFVYIEGFVNTFLKDDTYKVYFESSDGEIFEPYSFVDYVKKEKICLEGHYYYEKYFKVKIPIKKDGFKLKVKFVFRDNFPRNVDIGFTNNCNLNRCTNNAYFRDNGFIVMYKNCQLCFRKDNVKSYLALERNLIKEIWKTKSKKLAIYRMLYFIMSIFIKKDIWLISDRPNKAGDNGEAFFKYLQTVKNNKAKFYFVIQKDSEDYEKMKKIGKVIIYDSHKYKLYMLLSKHVISSQASDYVINPFGKYKKFMVDLYKFKFTFLQHGITKDDISDWLNKANKKIDCFVTAGKPEYQSILDGDYYYDKNVVTLSGFPRHDNLLQMSDNKQKKILLIPTWRQSLKQCVDPKTDTSVYYDGFKESEYFKFYNELINNEKLIKCMKENGYTGLFCMHPLFTKQSIDFKENDVFKINNGYVNYQKEFSEGSLLVTDYSSVFFDFAYLNKPVIYTQFDKETFFDSHSYNQGYFSYEEDGFGPVCYDIESTVNEIIKSIKNDCKLSEKYQNNINKFYIEPDGKNSSRLYEKIISM